MPTILLLLALYCTHVAEPGPIRPPLQVLLLPCSNGYDYNTLGYDFHPVLEQALTENGIAPMEFPYQSLSDIPYYGVFHKKQARPILKATSADVLILTRFLPPPKNAPARWGYEIKVLHRKNMAEHIALRAERLATYADIEQHIRTQIAALVKEIQQGAK